MTKSELIEAIKGKFPHLTAKEIKIVLDIVLNQLIESLVSENRIEIRGFGSFSIRERSAMNAKNPRTNEQIHIDKRKVVYFRMGKELRKFLNGLND